MIRFDRKALKSVAMVVSPRDIIQGHQYVYVYLKDEQTVRYAATNGFMLIYIDILKDSIQGDYAPTGEMSYAINVNDLKPHLKEKTEGISIPKEKVIPNYDKDSLCHVSTFERIIPQNNYKGFKGDAIDSVGFSAVYLSLIYDSMKVIFKNPIVRFDFTGAGKPVQCSSEWSCGMKWNAILMPNRSI